MSKKSLILGTTTLALAASASLAVADVNQPQEITMRPLTTPASQITVAGDLGILMIPDLDTALALSVGGSYGVSEKLEVGAFYAFALKEFEAKGDLTVQAAFSLLEGNLAVAPNLTTGYDLFSEGIDPLGLGARVRFRVNDQLAINSPGSQLSIALDGDPKPIALGLPVGVSYQVSPALYAFVNTSIGNLSIADSTTTFIFADNLPLAVGAFFSPSNTMDFGGQLSWFDLKEASDTIAITLSARLHL